MSRESIRVVIADDEPPARERIRELLDERSGFDVVAECGTGQETLEAIRSKRPDLLFLDVEMPRMTGLDVVEALGPHGMPPTVFVTAYDAYAVRAFEVHALDYLLKPFDDRRFDESLRRASARIRSRELLEDLARGLDGLLGDVGTGSLGGRMEEPEPRAKPLERLVVKRGDRSILVPVEVVDWLEAANYYVVLHVGAETYVLDDSMANLEKRLGDRFVRIHRSTIVNLDRVVELNRMFHGDFSVTLDDGTELKLSRTYRSGLEERLGRSL